MCASNASLDVDRSSEESPLSALERKFIEEYLQGKGFSLEDLNLLPKVQAQQLRREACNYASLKLAEVEARATLRDEIHWGS
jgi:hypothetical protein